MIDLEQNRHFNQTLRLWKIIKGEGQRTLYSAEERKGEREREREREREDEGGSHGAGNAAQCYSDAKMGQGQPCLDDGVELWIYSG